MCSESLNLISHKSNVHHKNPSSQIKQFCFAKLTMIVVDKKHFLRHVCPIEQLGKRDPRSHVNVVRQFNFRSLLVNVWLKFFEIVISHSMLVGEHWPIFTHLPWNCGLRVCTNNKPILILNW